MNKNSTKRLFAIRGAAGAENTIESITAATVEMCDKIIQSNELSAENIVSFHFTLTKDLTVLNPATAFRKSCKSTDVSNIPLFVSQEAFIENAPEKIIRLMVTAYMNEGREPRHIYIRGAEKLRPDLNK